MGRGSEREAGGLQISLFIIGFRVADMVRTKKVSKEIVKVKCKVLQDP